jgi:hypothetical protein
MDPSNESCDTVLICGSVTLFTKRFNEQTKIDQVYEYIRQEFHSNLPRSHRVVYYDPTTMSLVNLEDQLRNGLNPFQSNSSIGVQTTTSTIDCIRLYIVSNTDSHTGKKSSDLIEMYAIIFCFRDSR